MFSGNYPTVADTEQAAENGKWVPVVNLRFKFKNNSFNLLLYSSREGTNKRPEKRSWINFFFSTKRIDQIPDHQPESVTFDISD